MILWVVIEWNVATVEMRICRKSCHPKKQRPENLTNISASPMRNIKSVILGNIIKLRETPKIRCTKHNTKELCGQVNCLGYGQNQTKCNNGQSAAKL